MYMYVQILSVLIRIRSDRHRFAGSGYVPYPFQHKVKINYTFHKKVNILFKVMKIMMVTRQTGREKLKRKFQIFQYM
jgi:hypothetical protein